MNLVFRSLGFAGGLFFLHWSVVRLNCLFYSAFEYAQAALILRSLSPLMRLLGGHHWLYRGFFDCWHVRLRILAGLSAGLLVLQYWLPSPAVWLMDALLLLLGAVWMVMLALEKREGTDRQRHVPFNAFAPLRPEDRKHLNRQRNAVTLTFIGQRLPMPSRIPEDDRLRQTVTERYSRY